MRYNKWSQGKDGESDMPKEVINRLLQSKFWRRIDRVKKTASPWWKRAHLSSPIKCGLIPTSSKVIRWDCITMVWWDLACSMLSPHVYRIFRQIIIASMFVNKLWCLVNNSLYICNVYFLFAIGWKSLICFVWNDCVHSFDWCFSPDIKYVHAFPLFMVSSNFLSFVQSVLNQDLLA